MTKYKISVTQECIDKGIRGMSSHCPIAKAIQNAIPLSIPDIGATPRSFFLHNYVDYEFIMPLEAINFVHNFDEGRPVQPFEFEIEPSRFNNVPEVKKELELV